MRPRPFSPLVLYLLHLDKPVGRARHYMGSTFANRLETRLHHHARGQGARLTRRAVQEGVGFRLAMVRYIASRQAEHARKKRGHYERDCPICQGVMDGEELLTFPPDPPTQPAWGGLSFACQATTPGQTTG